MRRLLWLPLLFLSGWILSGCILSREPLVGPDDHVWLFGDGALFQDLSGAPGAWAPAEPFSAREVVRDGDMYRMTVYRDARKADAKAGDAKAAEKPLRFRLLPIDPARWILAAAIPHGDGTVWLYAHLHREGSAYVLTQLLRPQFLAFSRYMDANHSVAWSGLRHMWRDDPKQNAVFVSDLSFLRMLVPRMVDRDTVDRDTASSVRMAFRPATGDLETVLRRRIALIARAEAARTSLAKVEDDLRRVCGGRVCSRRDGRTVYRTEAEPHRWYDDRGRLVAKPDAAP